MRSKNLILTLGALALAACSQKDLDGDLALLDRDEISFCVCDSAQSRATATGSSAFAGKSGEWGLGMYCYYTRQSSWADYLKGAANPDFMKDQLAEYKGGAWSYHPVKYWPNGKGDKLSFIAYYPKLKTAAAKPTKASLTAQNLPQIAVDITDGSAITTASMIDLVVSDDAIDLTKDKGTVALGFRHAMCRLGISARQMADEADENVAVFIKSVTIEASSGGKIYKTGTYGWEKTATGVKGEWTAVAEYAGSIVLDGILAKAPQSWGSYATQSVKLSQDGEPTPLLKDGESLFLIPTGESPISAVARIEYTIANKSTRSEESVTVDVPITNVKLKEGETHSLCFTVGI